MHVQNSEKYQGTLCFSGQAHAKCPITPECKKYIQYSEKFQGNSVFRASAGYSKLQNNKKYIQYSENFQGKRRLLKNPE